MYWYSYQVWNVYDISKAWLALYLNKTNVSANVCSNTVWFVISEPLAIGSEVYSKASIIFA